MKNEEIKFLKEQTKQDFEILKKWTNESKLSYDESYSNLKELVAYRINKLLQKNSSQLMEALYKADVNEMKVRECFSSVKDSKEIASDIAALYLERLLQKWKYRQLYKNDIPGDWD